MLGTTRSFSRLGYVFFLGSIVAVACSSESGLDVKSSTGGTRSTTGSGSTTDTSSGASTNTKTKSTGTSTSNGGASNTDGTEPPEGGAGDTLSSEPTTGKGGNKSTKTGKGLGGAGNTDTHADMGGTVNYGEGGSRFGGDLAGAGPGCSNAEKDAGETDVDCGGTCAPARRCEAGQGCATALDCYSSSCIDSVCKDPTVIIKNAGCIGTTATTKCPTPAQDMRVRIQMMNVTSKTLDVDGYEMRYYFTDETAPDPGAEARVDDKSLNTTNYSVSIVAMETPVPGADHYISVKLVKATIAPDVNRQCDRSADNTDCAELEMNVHAVNYAQIMMDPSNDYSFVPASGYVNNVKITVHNKSGQLVWGIPPS